jgi:hypothetical protein
MQHNMNLAKTRRLFIASGHTKPNYTIQVIMVYIDTTKNTRASITMQHLHCEQVHHSQAL